jgi:uncharacterized membrane protein YeaQ/YmgE (transglycosylase-associated protein family)
VTRAGDGASIDDSDGALYDGSSTDDEWFCRSKRRIAPKCRTTVGGAISLSASNVIPGTGRYPLGLHCPGHSQTWLRSSALRAREPSFDIPLGIVGAIIGGWLYDLFGGSGVTGFNIEGVYSAGIAAIGAIIVLVPYHAFFRRSMLRMRISSQRLTTYVGQRGRLKSATRLPSPCTAHASTSKPVASSRVTWQGMPLRYSVIEVPHHPGSCRRNLSGSKTYHVINLERRPSSPNFDTTQSPYCSRCRSILFIPFIFKVTLAFVPLIQPA